MITYKKRNITEERTGIIAHGVNCQRVMGSGVAKAIKDQFPAVYKHYLSMGKGSQLLGKVSFIPISNNLWIANCYTQIYYGRETHRRYADPDAIKSCLESVYAHASSIDFDVKMPQIGCGLGGLSWDKEIKPIVIELQERYRNVNTYIFEL